MPKSHIREELVKAVKMGNTARIEKLKREMKTGEHYHTVEVKFKPPKKKKVPT